MNGERIITALERAIARIEQLEAALREIARFPVTNKNRAGTQMMKIAKGALEQGK
jgi:phage-related protein